MLRAPLQLGLGLPIHHYYSSWFLIGTLNSLAFSYSSSDVERFDRSAAVTQGIEIPLHTRATNHVADNVEHNK